MARENYAAAERAALCDLMSELGPDQPTLCDGWRTRDLAAHLVIRERRPVTASGVVFKSTAGRLERVQRSYAQRPFPELLEVLRRPPRWSPMLLPPIDRAVNTMELFVHHEDIRRAQPDWRPRTLPADLDNLLWARARAFARLQLRRFRAGVVVEAPGHGEVRTGAGGPEVRLRGAPGELMLFLYGRQRYAEVALTGPEELTARLERAGLGI
jgi:uncharacterized protein (TIGR03085 family)